jgi:hypothetical protein
MKLKEFKKTIEENARFNIPKNQEFVQQISQIETTYMPQTHYHFPIRRLITSAFSIIILATIAFGIWINQYVVSTITLDINPSIELSLNTFGKVIHITASNEDGEDLISQTEFSNMQYSNVVTALYQECIRLGYTTQDSGYLLLGISSSNYEDEQVLAANLISSLSQSTVNVIYVSKHSETDYILYSGFVYYSTRTTQNNATGSMSATTTSKSITNSSTTSPTDSSTVESGIPSSSDYANSDYAIVSTLLTNYTYMSSEEFVSLAEILGISDAKLQVCISIYVNNSSYQTEDGLTILANLPLEDLFALFEQIHS